MKGKRDKTNEGLTFFVLFVEDGDCDSEYEDDANGDRHHDDQDDHQVQTFALLLVGKWNARIDMVSRCGRLIVLGVNRWNC